MRLGEGTWRDQLPAMGHLCTRLTKRQPSSHPLPTPFPTPLQRAAGDGTGFVPTVHLSKQSDSLRQQPDIDREAGDSPQNAME